MINYFNARIESIFVHKVGNRAKSEKLFLSDRPLELDDEKAALLKEYFLKPFKENTSFYGFTDEQDIVHNTVYNSCSEVFHAPKNTEEESQTVAQHLYDESNHPHIRSGEVYFAYIKGITLDGEPIDTIGIFKSEIKKDFMNFSEETSNLEMELQQGIDLSKLDKGCLVFNTEKEGGYKVMTVDSNRYDTRYWVEDFLGITPKHDSNYLTKDYITMAANFGKEVVEVAEDKIGRLEYNRKVEDYFTNNDTFDEDDFVESTMENPDLKREYKNYKEQKGKDEQQNRFDISNKVATDTIKKKIKSEINLDTGYKISANPPNVDYIEKGWDEDRQMYYYLVYFNKEDKSN